MTLEVFEENCDSSKGVPLAAVAPAASYALEIAGSGGISITGQKPGRCSIIASLKIDPNTPAGKEYVTLLDAAGAPVTSAELMVQSASAGAIPPGLEPEVDVLWEVMSQTDCADAFGTRLSASLYCIQLKIGNNTGFPIQLAGIGFANRLTDLAALGDPTVTFANNSYASTRAILLHQEMWAPRNVLYHSLEGAGLIMAGFTPFFVRPNAKTNFATATSIVSGPLLQAFGIVATDPIISQLNNLDDQSFRDNLVIPNNTHIQTVVFVEKQALTDSLRDLRIRLDEAASDPKNSTTANAVMTEMADSAKTSIRNSKVPGFFGRQGKQDPSLVKLALGRVVIVGQEIEYLQRVQVLNNASGESASGVTITPKTFSVAAASPTTEQFAAAVTNDQSNAGVTWALSGHNCQADACGALAPTTTTATYTAPKAQPAPDDTVTLTATSKADTSKFDTATITIEIPFAITATGGAAQAATINTAFSRPLEVTVIDSAGNPVNGAVVTFTPPAAGASGTFASGVNTATTNASGVATSVTFTSNGTGGPYNVTARVAGVASPANFPLTNN